MESNEWLGSLKIAVIEKDLSTLEKLAQSFPVFDSKEQMQEALALIQEASGILSNEQADILLQMQKIQKTKEYLS